MRNINLDDSPPSTSSGSPTPLNPRGHMGESAECNEKTQTTPQQAEEAQRAAALPSFPEGGLQAWLTVAGGSLVTFCTFGVVQSFGVYQDYYTRVSLTDRTASEISWIGSVQVFLLFAVGLLAGRLFDAGHFHATVISGTVIYLVSLFLLSLCRPHHFYQNFLAQGVGMGIGMGLLFLPCLTVTTHYFRRRRSIAMGFVIGGSSFGAVLYPILLNNLFNKPNRGFGWGVRAVGFLDLGCLVIANCIMRTRLPPRKKMHGVVGYGEILKDTPYLVFIFGSFCIFWGSFIPFFYLQLYTALHDIPSRLVTYVLSIMNVASLFGRTVPNFLADAYGPINVIIPSAILTASLIFAMLGATNIPGVVLFAIFYGYFSGACISLVSPAAGTFSTRRDGSDIGVRLGLLSFGISFGVLTGNPIAGALLTSHRHWIRPLLFAAVVNFAGALSFILVWRPLSIRRNTKLV